MAVAGDGGTRRERAAALSDGPARRVSTGAAGGTAASHAPSLWLLGVALVLLALNLRLVFPSVAVLLPEITRSTGMSSAVSGYLTTLPVLCMGVFAPLAPWCQRRFGMERTLLAALLVLAAGTALRGLAGSTGLFVGSALAGAAIAVANVLLPALVKRDYASRVAGMTAVYTMAMYVGAAGAAAGSVPLTGLLHSPWRAGVMVWALPAVVAAAAWLPWLWQPRRPTVDAAKSVRRKGAGLWGSGFAWQVTFFMGLQSAMAYIATGWLAPILRSRGMDATSAGVVTSVVMFMNVVGALGAPFLLRRFRDQRGIDVALACVAGGALLALLLAPTSMVWLWAVLQGLGQGSMFAVALTVIVLRSPDAGVAARLSSMAQTVGYIVAAAGPLLVGLLLDWTGGFGASAALFVALIVGSGVAGWGAGRARYVTAAG